MAALDRQSFDILEQLGAPDLHHLNLTREEGFGRLFERGLLRSQPYIGIQPTLLFDQKPCAGQPAFMNELGDFGVDSSDFLVDEMR